MLSLQSQKATVEFSVLLIKKRYVKMMNWMIINWMNNDYRR